MIINLSQVECDLLLEKEREEAISNHTPTY